MSLLNLPVIASSAILFWISYTPPSTAPPPVKSDKAKLGGMEMSFGRFIPVLSKICKIEGAIGYAFEAAVIIASHTPQSPASVTTSSLTPSADLANLKTPPAFFVGAALVTCGGFLRLACYRSLGSLFTFQLLVRDNHRLITDGPYTHIRHPSYAALWLVAAGATFMLFGPGSPFWQLGWMDTLVGRGILAMWLIQRVAECVHMIPRIKYEDRFLKEEFGKEWESWARSTPYRLFPYVW
ncbi:hypothetical protein OF83DRAFT_1048371 [Amylostereum chailletii]|nr:hypothetical protein OF83DRAFT_1048371 [Amylostereum chailletii]